MLHVTKWAMSSVVGSQVLSRVSGAPKEKEVERTVRLAVHCHCAHACLAKMCRIVSFFLWESAGSSEPGLSAALFRQLGAHACHNQSIEVRRLR